MLACFMHVADCHKNKIFFSESKLYVHYQRLHKVFVNSCKKKYQKIIYSEVIYTCQSESIMRDTQKISIKGLYIFL